MQNASNNDKELHLVTELSIIMAVTVSLGGLYAKSIFSIFLLCMESNAWEKSAN